MKPKGMDGPIDLFLYRPIGFAIAWVLSFTRTSPNAVTIISAVMGLASGLCALGGTTQAFLLCAIFFQISNCFDCADGQLARMTGQYSPEGRILDGLSDYFVNICVYAGVLMGLIRAGRSNDSVIVLAIAGGAATIVSCMYYDRAITRFAAFLRGSAEDEVDIAAKARVRAAESRGAARLLWRIYAFYVRLQSEGELRAARGHKGMSGAVSGPAGSGLVMTEEVRRAYGDSAVPLLMAWSFTGPSAHVLYFLVFAMIGKIEWYFVACVVLALATGSFLIIQQLVYLRQSKRLLED
jgi:phosphatidylglycerophosphate synthase